MGWAWEWQIPHGERRTECPFPYMVVGYFRLARKRRTDVQASGLVVGGLSERMLKRGTGIPPGILISKSSTRTVAMKDRMALRSFSRELSSLKAGSVLRMVAAMWLQVAGSDQLFLTISSTMFVSDVVNPERDSRSDGRGATLKVLASNVMLLVDQILWLTIVVISGSGALKTRKVVGMSPVCPSGGVGGAIWIFGGGSFMAAAISMMVVWMRAVRGWIVVSPFCPCQSKGRMRSFEFSASNQLLSVSGSRLSKNSAAWRSSMVGKPPSGVGVNCVPKGLGWGGGVFPAQLCCFLRLPIERGSVIFSRWAWGALAASANQLLT